MSQIKNSLDKDTIAKIIKGSIIAGVGSGALYLLSVIGALEISNPILVSFLAWIIPVATNAIKEYMKGEGVPVGSSEEEELDNVGGEEEETEEEPEQEKEPESTEEPETEEGTAEPTERPEESQH